MTWTPERTDLLRSLWANGDSASQIAKQLGGGVSRNAVIGKVHRLGLAKRDPYAAHLAGCLASIKKLKAKPKPPRAAACDPVVKPEIQRPRAVTTSPNDRGCRWITGDPRGVHHWCQEPALPGQSYCQEHRRKAYQPVVKK